MREGGLVPPPIPSSRPILCATIPQCLLGPSCSSSLYCILSPR